MEKTIMISTSLQQLLPPPPCPNCDRLQQQIAQLNGHIIEVQEDTEHSNFVIEQITNELLKLRDQYKQLKEKMNRLSINHEEQFSQNAIITRQLEMCRNQLGKYQQKGGKQQSMAETCESLREQSSKQGAERKGKESQRNEEVIQRELALRIEQQKVATLEQTTRELTEEIFKLKEYLSRRNSIQKRRHNLIQAL